MALPILEKKAGWTFLDEFELNDIFYLNALLATFLGSKLKLLAKVITLLIVEKTNVPLAKSSNVEVTPSK